MSLNISDVVDFLSTLKAVDAAKLIKEMEERWNVSSEVKIEAVASAGVDESSAAEEKTEFDVVLENFGEKKVNVIKVVRQITGLGLKEAKELVESAPKAVKEAVAKDEAEQIKKQLEEAGAKVSVK